MSDDPELEREADALLALLPDLADEITVEQAAQDDRYARRLAIFLRLTDLGIRQSRIADAAKVTPMAVSYAIGAHRRKAATKSSTPKRSRDRGGSAKASGAK